MKRSEENEPTVRISSLHCPLVGFPSCGRSLLSLHTHSNHQVPVGYILPVVHQLGFFLPAIALVSLSLLQIGSFPSLTTPHSLSFVQIIKRVNQL